MPSVLHVRLFRGEVERFVKGRNGPVVLHQANVGRQVAAVARRKAPRSEKAGPHLADNISSRLVPSPRGYDVEVVAGVPWAVYVHRGTAPHSIGSSVHIGGVGWRYIGMSPAGRGKIHPGTRPNPFMLEAVRSLGIDAREVR